MRKIVGVLILLFTLITASVTTYLLLSGQQLSIAQTLSSFRFNLNFFNLQTELRSPFIANPTKTPQELPLNQYSIPNLRNYEYTASQVTLIEKVSETDQFSTFLFKYQTMGKTMTGTLNLPNSALASAKTNATTDATANSTGLPVIIMVRGYATPAQYSPGFGTRNAAATFASNGYVTLAIDFFGFGESDPEPEDSWEARFIKPINVIELIKSIQAYPKLSLAIDETVGSVADNTVSLDPNQIGIWAHSNGGQITLSVLQILSEPIPATLWAPVTAPFPYSILFFTRTSEDEGKQARAWLAMFERDFDVFEFSITRHLHLLNAPIQVHHGGQDPEALQAWSDSFIELLKQENQRRTRLRAEMAEANSTSSASTNTDLKLPTADIDFNYYVYPQADHNLQPAANWQQAMTRDLAFFKQYLTN